MSTTSNAATATAGQNGAGHEGLAAPDSGSDAVLERAGGVAGLVFVAGVALQNAVLLSGSPMPDADLAEITDFYASGESRITVAVALVAVNVVCLLLFASSVANRLDRHPAARVAARAGFGGAVVLIGAFLTTTAVQAVLVARVESLDAAGQVQLLWDLHSAAFAMSASSLAVVLGAFSLGSLLGGAVVPRWTALLGLVGGGALLVAGALVVSTLDGGAGLFLQLVGFVIWLVFLVAASVRLVRR